MITIAAKTTSKFFGEPIYLGELSKDIISAALGIERSEFRFEHSKNSDNDAVDVIIVVDTMGEEDIARRIEDAIMEALKPTKVKFSVEFTELISHKGQFNTDEKLAAAVMSAKNTDDLMNAHMRYSDPLSDLIEHTHELMERLYRNN